MKKLLGICILAYLCGCASAYSSEPPQIRVAYNYCTLSYTFAYYTDADWDDEIGRLAKAGYSRYHLHRHCN